MATPEEYCRLCKHSYNGEAGWGSYCGACVMNPAPRHANCFRNVPKSRLAQRNLTIEDWERSRQLQKEADKDVH